MPEQHIDPRKEFSAALIQFCQAILYMLNRQHELKQRSADLLCPYPGGPVPVPNSDATMTARREPRDDDGFEKETRARTIELGEQIREAWCHVRDCLDKVKETAIVPADVEGVSGGQWRVILLGEVDEVAEIVGGNLLAPSKAEREAKKRAGKPVYVNAKLELPSEKEREHLIFMLDRLSKRYVRDIRNQLIAPPPPPPAVETTTPKANGAGKRGHPGISEEEEDYRNGVLQRWDQAKAARVPKKQFCEDEPPSKFGRIKPEDLKRFLTWRKSKDNRRHKIPPQEK